METSSLRFGVGFFFLFLFFPLKRSNDSLNGTGFWCVCFFFGWCFASWVAVLVRFLLRR